MKSSIIQRLALPMFVSGLIAMILSAIFITTNPAFAAGAAGMKISTVKLQYVTTGYIELASACGGQSGKQIAAPNFRTSTVFGIKSNDKWFNCEVTLTVLTK